MESLSNNRSLYWSLLFSSKESCLSELHSGAEGAEGKVRIKQSEDIWQHNSQTIYGNSLLSFRKFIQDSDDDDDDGDKGGEGSGESQLLTRRIKTQEEKVRNCYQLPPSMSRWPEVLQIWVSFPAFVCVCRIKKRQTLWSGWRARLSSRVQRRWRTWWVWDSKSFWLKKTLCLT